MNATPKRAEFPVGPAISAGTSDSLLEARLAAAEAKLADAEEILGDALLSSSSWIWESDAEHCFSRIIGPIETIFGTKPEKLIGKKVEDFTRDGDDPSTRYHFDTIQQRKPYRDVVSSINTPKGVRYVKASGKPLYDGSGKFLGYRGTGCDVTDQIQTERRASEANRRFMEAIENVPASLMLCDRQDRIVFCNSATQRYFPTASHLLIPGTKYEDLLRAHAASGFVAEIGKDFEGWMQERMRSHRSGNTNITRSYSDGRWSQIIERRTSDGGVIGIRTDITELKKREQELERLGETLRMNQEHLAQAQRTSGTGSVERNLQTGEVKWSDECSRMFDSDPALPPPNPAEFLTLIHPDDRAAYEASMMASENGLSSEPFKFRTVHGNGSVHWLYCESSVKFDADGKPWKRIVTYRDVTIEHESYLSLKELAEKLRASQEHLDRAQRISRTGSDERNLVTDECKWSDTTYEIFGVNRENFVPSYDNFLAMVHPGDRHICLAMRQDLYDGKVIKPYEYRIIRPDGQMRTIYRETVVNRDESGKPVSYTGTLRDVTELRAAEESIRQKTREIEAHAAELQRSNAELEQFAYVASHDLQEPLRMVASYCQLLQRRYKDKLDADANEFIGFAVEGANRMQRLINDLLGYSRTGRGGGNPENFRSTDALKGAIANLQGAISESGAKIEFGELPMVRADRTQITQLFQNLIGNAIKFRRDGVSPLIRVAAAAEGKFWHFTVEDNGIGIEKDYLDRVFLIFQRLHERNKYPGTGIGLAIAKKVIEHHGGRIWIESTPGQGSKFNFTLPATAKTETL